MKHILKDKDTYGVEWEIINAKVSGTDLVSFTSSITPKVNLKGFLRTFVLNSNLFKQRGEDFATDIISLSESDVAWGAWGLNDDPNGWCKDRFSATAEKWHLIYIQKNT